MPLTSCADGTAIKPKLYFAYLLGGYRLSNEYLALHQITTNTKNKQYVYKNDASYSYYYQIR